MKKNHKVRKITFEFTKMSSFYFLQNVFKYGLSVVPCMYLFLKKSQKEQ